METTPTTASPTAGALSQAAGAVASSDGEDAAAAAATAAGDFTTFLTLLTAQIRNQDPLDPVDSTQFVAQLASFSAVEQQVRSNSLLEDLLSAVQGDSASGAGLADWIGVEVMGAGEATYGGAPVEVRGLPSADADRAELVVRDASDTVVHRATVDPAATSFTWSGAGGSSGDAYSFTVESFKGEGLIASTTGAVFAPVREARLNGGAVTLVLQDGTEIAAEAAGDLRAKAAG